LAARDTRRLTSCPAWQLGTRTIGTAKEFFLQARMHGSMELLLTFEQIMPALFAGYTSMHEGEPFMALGDPVLWRFIQVKTLRHISLFLCFAQSLTWAQNKTEDRVIRLDGKSARVVVEIGGGAISDFHLVEQKLNPLSWREPGSAPGLRWSGHFLCLDRWGPPSEAEERNGMPYHGEVSRVEWQLLQGPDLRNGQIVVDMNATLPLAGLMVKRQIRMSQSDAFFTVREEVSNTQKLGRIYNIVQHPTIAPPFLDETTFVDANGRKGFIAYRPLPNPEEPAVYWPQAFKDGIPVNLRYLTNDHDPNVVSYTLDDEYGWVTASNPGKGLLIGYIWKTKDYPWLIDWRDVQNGRPAARGLEFGTTGLPHPDPILVAKGKIFGRQLFEHLDAGQTVAKSYAAFLLKIPANYKGVSRIDYREGRLVLHERYILYEKDAGPERDLVVEVGVLFPQ